MGRFAKEPEGGGDFQDVEPGNYAGRCYRVIELGTTHQEFNSEIKTRNRLMISFELPGEPMDDGRPHSVTWWVTNSLHEKANLRIGLDLWRKRPFTEAELQGFDLAKIIGAPAMVTVQHNKKGRASVAGVGPLPKGMVCGPAVNETTAFFLDEYSDAKFAALPNGIQKLIMESDEYKAIQMERMNAARKPPAQPKDDLPWDDDERGEPIDEPNF